MLFLLLTYEQLRRQTVSLLLELSPAYVGPFYLDDADRRAQTERRLTKVEAELKNLADAVAEIGWHETLKEKLEELTAEKKRLGGAGCRVPRLTLVLLLSVRHAYCPCKKGNGSQLVGAAHCKVSLSRKQTSESVQVRPFRRSADEPGMEYDSNGRLS